MRTFFLSLALLLSMTCLAQSQHDTKRMKQIYSSDQIKTLKEHTKMLNASGQYKNVSEYCPTEASHTYFKAMTASGASGLIYDACANTASDTSTQVDILLVPANYEEFQFMAPSDKNKPYYAKNSFGNPLRNIYYHHKQEGEIVVAKHYGATTYDVYSIKHCGNLVTSKCIYSSLPAPIKVIPGYIVTGATQQYVSNDATIPFYYFRSTDRSSPLVMYDTNGNAITRAKDGISMICMGYETSSPTKNTPLLYISFNQKGGAGLIGDKMNMCTPGIFAAADWNNEQTAISIKCTPTSEFEIYNPDIVYEGRMKDPTSIVYPFVVKGDAESAIKAYDGIAEADRTGEDALYAASACYSKACADYILTKSNILLLQDNLGSQIYETQDVSISLLAINTAYSLIDVAENKDPSIKSTCDTLRSNLKTLSANIQTSKVRFNELNKERIKKQERAEFWGTIFSNVAKQAVSSLTSAISEAIKPSSPSGSSTVSGKGGSAGKGTTASSSSSDDEDSETSKGVPGYVRDRYYQLKKLIKRQEEIIPHINKEWIQREEEERLERYVQEYEELKGQYNLK